MSYLERDGHEVYFQVSGGASGGAAGGDPLPVLLSHGFGASSAMWEPNLGALAAARQVITWDLRGHGRSGSPDDPAQYSEAACVADMAAVLDACGVSRAVIGGLSLGGYLSLAFWRCHPERVAGLLLCDTGPGYRSAEARQRWNDHAIKTARRLERDGLPAMGNSPETRSAGHRSAHGLAQAARGILAQRDARVIESLPAIAVPVLVLVGERDRPFQAAADYLTAKIPGAAAAVIPDAGHACNIDQPGLFNEQVLSFLDQAVPS